MSRTKTSRTKTFSTKTSRPTGHGDAAPPRTAVVIGAGITGIATAALLAREGLDVTILDKNSIENNKLAQTLL